VEVEMRTFGKIALTLGVVCTVLVAVTWLWLVGQASEATDEMNRDMGRMLEQLDRLSEETDAQPCLQCESELALCRMMLEASQADATIDAGSGLRGAGDAGAR
jgi:hypothetical protein